MIIIFYHNNIIIYNLLLLAVTHIGIYQVYKSVKYFVELINVFLL